MTGNGSMHGGGTQPDRPRRVMVLGASGTIGRAVVRELAARRYRVCRFVRAAAVTGERDRPGVETRTGDPADPVSLRDEGFRGERFDALVCCMASRTGEPHEAWRIDHAATVAAIDAAAAAGANQVVLLSAICVQKPRLAFQHAKLAAERHLQASGLDWSIVRPTAFFKSLSGQVDRVRRGKPYLVFGDGRLTACKPIADEDLAAFIADCLERPACRNRILPIGGPGPAASPIEQGEALFALAGRPPRFRHVPVRLLDTVIRVLDAFGRMAPRLAAKAELARIGRYYATESMLVLDPETGRYDADATPETGTRTLADHHARLLAGSDRHERGAQSVF